MAHTLPISCIIRILKETKIAFGDVKLEIKVNHDPNAKTCAELFLPPLKSQTSMPFTPNIYAPHGCIFSQN